MSWLLAMHMLYLIHWLLLITCEGGTILVLFLQMKKLRLWTVREPVQGHRVSEWQSWELDPRLQRPLSPLAHRPASPLGINKKPKAFMLIKHQVREALREGLIPQGAAVTEAGPRPWAEKDSAQSREQGAMSNTNCGRLSGSGPRLCSEASNRVPGHWVMPETFNLNQTQNRKRAQGSQGAAALQSCLEYPPVNPWHHSSVQSGDQSPSLLPFTLSTHSPSAGRPSTLKVPPIFAQLLLCPPGPSQHMQIHPHTHVQTHAHSYVSMHKHAYICPSYHPSSLSLRVRKTGKPLWYSLCESGSDSQQQSPYNNLL